MDGLRSHEEYRREKRDVEEQLANGDAAVGLEFYRVRPKVSFTYWKRLRNRVDTVDFRMLS